MAKRINVVICIAVLGGLVTAIGGGVFAFRERRLSGTFKHILIAAQDGSNTDTDIVQYLHEARIAARTARDREVLETYESAVRLAVESNAEMESLKEEVEAAKRKKSVEDFQKSIELEEYMIRDDQRYGVSKQTTAYMERTLSYLKEMKAEAAKSEEARQSKWKADLAKSDADRQQSEVLTRQVRAELGLSKRR